MKTRVLSKLAAALALVGSAAAAADAAPPPCWAAGIVEPVSNDGLPIAHPSFAPLHRALDVLEQMSRRNAGLAQLPEVRLRTRREVHDADEPSRHPRPAVLHVGGFGPKAWGRGDCEVIPQADRLGARVGISFFVNQPTARLQRWMHDEQLTIYLEGERSEPMQGWPVYGGCAVLTPARRIWWLPVTVGEWLDFQAREQQRRIEDHDRRNARHLEPFDLAAAEAQARAIEPLDAKAAATLLAVARQRKAGEAGWHARLRAVRDGLVAELDALHAFRAALPAERAAEPFRLGNGRFRLPAPGEVDRPLKRLVKLDPSYPWDLKRRERVQVLHVCPSLIDRNPTYGPPMREAVRDLDIARIAALLD